MNTLQNYLGPYLNTTIVENNDRLRFIERLTKNKFTKKENLLSHFGSMFIPYDKKNKKIFLVHHKKANSWIFPGGHMEYGELPKDTAIREITEELGVNKKDVLLENPFTLQICDLDNPLQKCKEHFDIFYTFKINADLVNRDPREFFDAKWVSFKEAEAKIELEYYQLVFSKFKKYIKA